MTVLTGVRQRVVQIGKDIWWAYRATPIPEPIPPGGSVPMHDWRVRILRTEFVGDIFSGPRAYELAMAWRPPA